MRLKFDKKSGEKKNKKQCLRPKLSLMVAFGWNISRQDYRRRYIVPIYDHFDNFQADSSNMRCCSVYFLRSANRVFSSGSRLISFGMKEFNNNLCLILQLLGMIIMLGCLESVSISLSFRKILNKTQIWRNKGDTIAVF